MKKRVKGYTNEVPLGYTNRVQLAHFETLKLIQNGLSISEIASHRKVTRKAVYKVLSTLTKHGMVRNPKRSIYELTDKGIKGTHSLVGYRYKVRQHNLHFKIKVLESPKNWSLRRNEYRQMPYFNRTLKLKNNDQDLFNYGNLSLKTTSQSIIIKMPTLYATDWEHALIQAMQILEDSIPKIENLFNVRLIKNYKNNITIISQEYARIQDALARLYRGDGNRLYVTGDDGKIWMITDFSFSTDETEFIHPNNATDDLDAIAPFLNDLRKNPTTLTAVREHVGELQGIVNSWAVNQVKHQKVLDKMYSRSEVLDLIPKLVNQLDMINNRLNNAGL